MTTVRGTVIDHWIRIPAPVGIPNGTEVFVTIDTSPPEVNDDGPVSPEEIARVLAAMDAFDSESDSSDFSAGFDEWEQEINDHGSRNSHRSLDSHPSAQQSP